MFFNNYDSKRRFTKFARHKRNCLSLQQRLNRGTQLVVQQKRQQLTQTVQSLDLLSPLKIMTRGYAFVTADEQVVHGVKQLQPEQTVANAAEAGGSLWVLTVHDPDQAVSWFDVFSTLWVHA